MALDRHIARLSKILVDDEGISFDGAQAHLRALTLEIIVGDDATSPAAHAAILTAVSVGSRTFVGGVRVTGNIGQPLNSALPVAGGTLAAGALQVGATPFEGKASQRIVVGGPAGQGDEQAISAWWRGWRAGLAAAGAAACDDGDNPLTGIAAGALAVGAAFQAARGHDVDLSGEIDLWPTTDGEPAPRFAEVFLPGALWLVGLGNLGQAFLWALTALPYANAAEVSVVLQDKDKVAEENWATSVLVHGEIYGDLKTKIAEAWASAKGFDVRRVDRRLLGGDRLEDDDPRLALCGVDKIEPRKLMAKTGFECIIDAGLGRKSSDFDRYRVTVFDDARPIDRHFEGQSDNPPDESAVEEPAYQELQAEVGRCGMAEIAGASVAAPYVSAVAAAVAIARAIAVTSGCACQTNEVRRLSRGGAKPGPLARMNVRAIRHAGRPASVADNRSLSLL